ncbi:cyclopropane-fatty-acyl-phospholipid synthase family protein [Alphaproteobacteria bacterium]|nr:cyclopropane-fatty-acyl-phospholipid synthase family protein [Alphaproteobacteria bacterium]
MGINFLVFVLRRLCKGDTIKIIYNDKEYLVGNFEATIIIKINNHKFIRKLFYAPSLALTEGYMEQDFEIIKGTFYTFTKLIIDNYNRFINKFSKSILYKLYLLANPLFQLNFSFKSQKNVAHHYDLSDKLYDLFLDKNRQYSCAYFENDNDTLEKAQINKMQRLAGKLHLQANDKVLDIGCGWGGLSRYFVDNYDCFLKGISLSKEQIKFCEEYKLSFPKSSNLYYALQDYRLEDNKYNKIVSVGMFEHVGKPFYATYFKKIHDLLEDDGIAVVHSIGNVSNPKVTAAFIRKYIFPGGYIPSLSEITPAIEKSGLIVSDIEVIRIHYAKTISHWFKNFQNNMGEIKNLYDERFVRMWEVYLNLSELSFTGGNNVIFQLVLTKKKDAFPIVR